MSSINQESDIESWNTLRSDTLNLDRIQLIYQAARDVFSGCESMQILHKQWDKHYQTDKELQELRSRIRTLSRTSREASAGSSTQCSAELAYLESHKARRVDEIQAAAFEAMEPITQSINEALASFAIKSSVVMDGKRYPLFAPVNMAGALLISEIATDSREDFTLPLTADLFDRMINHANSKLRESATRVDDAAASALAVLSKKHRLAALLTNLDREEMDTHLGRFDSLGGWRLSNDEREVVHPVLQREMERRWRQWKVKRYEEAKHRIEVTSTTWMTELPLKFDTDTIASLKMPKELHEKGPVNHPFAADSPFWQSPLDSYEVYDVYHLNDDELQPPAAPDIPPAVLQALGLAGQDYANGSGAEGKDIVMDDLTTDMDCLQTFSGKGKERAR